MVEFGSLMPPSSRGLGRSPFKAKTGVRIPVEALAESRRKSGFLYSPFDCVEAQAARKGGFC
jgi:hypothetical protein